MTLAHEGDEGRYLLARLGAPINIPMMEAVVAWKRAESGNHVQRNNPLNIRYFQGEPGFSHMEGGFSVFTSLENGWRAVQFGLEKWPKGNFRKYAEIVQAARSGNPTVFLNAIAASAWDSGHYGMRNGGVNKLLGIYHNVVLHGTLLDNITPGPIGDISVGFAQVRVDEEFTPPREFTVHEGTTVTGYNQQQAVKTASWNRDSIAHTDEADTLTQTVDPEAVPHGKFYHVVDGVYAGLYIPQADVTLAAAPSTSNPIAPETPVDPTQLPTDPAPVDPAPIDPPVVDPAPPVDPPVVDPAPPVDPPVVDPAPPDCSQQVADAVAAKQAEWESWLATQPLGIDAWIATAPKS
jgi:hypothetical protein